MAFDLPGVITCDLRLNTPRFASLPNIMKAKKKPIKEIDLASLGVALDKKLEIVSTKAPEPRKGGIKVESVDELIDKLRNEAKVI